MNILHAHYQPPQKIEDMGGILFWMEISDVSIPKSERAAKKEKSRLHPFCADTATFRHVLNVEGASKTVTLRLPAVKGVPLPSPQLFHNWYLDSKNPKLAPFLVNGIWMRPLEAISVLLTFSTDGNATFSPAPDFRFWSMVGALALETLAAHKLIPVIINEDKNYYARWLPILDSPKDAARLNQLKDAMPAICRAGSPEHSPQNLINSFSTPSVIHSRANGENQRRRSIMMILPLQVG
ncbi:MAG: hypothetical protein L0287_32875 [Anaerolineae bacterium]|nr:hypothetical protein [Anaerolineae bacterium]